MYIKKKKKQLLIAFLAFIDIVSNQRQDALCIELIKSTRLVTEFDQYLNAY